MLLSLFPRSGDTRRISSSVGAMFVLVLSAASYLAAQPAPDRRSCEQIRAACQSAGFTAGGVRTGTGLQAHCIVPIMQGTDQPRLARKPLPKIDPQLVADCNAENPRFGQGQDQRAEQAAEPAAPIPPASAPAAQAPPGQPVANAGKRPNIVFVLTDDLAVNLVQYLPHVLQMQKDGVTFVNYFVTDSLCCPSRSSIFTGRFPHDTGIFRNIGNDGGFLAFHARHHERSTFAAALQAVGYRTAMLGKYLNGYQPKRHPPEPGWALWAVAGNGYPGFNYDLNQDGKVVHYGNRPVDYMTDVLSGIGTEFIAHSAGTPFMIEVATFAPRPMVLDECRLAPIGDLPPLHQRHQAAAIDIGGGRRATDFGECRVEVDVLDDFVDRVPGRHARTDDDERDFNICIVGGHLSRHQPELAHVIPVVRAEHEIGVVLLADCGDGRLQIADQLVHRLHRLGALAKILVDGGHSLCGKRRMLAQPLRLVGIVRRIEGSGARRNQPRKPVRVAGRRRIGRVMVFLFPAGIFDVNIGRPADRLIGRGISAPDIGIVRIEFVPDREDPDELRNTYSSLSAEAKAALRSLLSGMQNCHDAQNCLAAEQAVGSVTRK
jgi:hypothetical protein